MGLISFFLAGVDEFPILSSFESHFAEQCVFAFEFSSDDLPEKEDLRDEVSFGLEVVDADEGRQLGWHIQNIIQN